ncbi:hypothetical protein DBB31_17805 [Burkholderia multivorans]|nr:hypothetical protein DBB31_17805 [Burkholderia multivorans]
MECNAASASASAGRRRVRSDARLTPGFRRMRCAAMREPVRRRPAARRLARQPCRRVTGCRAGETAVAARFASI